MSTNARRPTCDIKTNHLTPNEAADTSLDLTGTIIVILGRMWDVSAVTGRYLNTDFVVSDAKGNMIHCSAKATVSHNFLRLKGSIYSIKKIDVKPNKDEYRLLKNDVYMLEFDGSTTIRKASVKADGFVRYPFQLGQSIRVTLWGSYMDVLIEKKTKQTGVCPVILSATCPKKYNNKVYLSSTSSTVIYDDDAIPAIKALKKANSVVDQQTFGTSVDLSQPQTRTLENLLMWARNRKNDSITFHCKITIDGIRTRKGWNFPSCGSDTCKKALTRQNSQFFCQSCNTTVDYPVLRYRLEVDVSDDTAHAVVVMFNETATALVNCSADSLMDTVDEILPSEGIKDSVGSSNLDDYPLINVEDSESKDSNDSANGTGK
ncbi:reverse transcriptase domain-containing protein [Tanacetum coccineum]